MLSRLFNRNQTTTYHIIRIVSLLAVFAALLLSGRRLAETAAYAADTAAPVAATVSAAVATSNPALATSAAAHASALLTSGEAEYTIPLPLDPPADRILGHPLEGVIAAMRSGKSTETRDWVLPLLVEALAKPMRDAHITGYSSRDADGGGPYTRWGTRTRWGICAADGRYWGPGSVIWMGDPVNQVLVVEDTGGAIKGQNRFDVCTGDNPASSARIGSRHANYVPLYVAPTRSNWGGKPDDWRPPVPANVRVAQQPTPQPH
ncbi:MAG TPA: 3D domain-containing protein [Armatimonadota bacterium]|jgi:3D (Asp-Asp-Asp) domain-containing protein